MFHIIVTEESHLDVAENIVRFEVRVDNLDLSALSALLLKKPRSDKGKPRVKPAEGPKLL